MIGTVVSATGSTDSRLFPDKFPLRPNRGALACFHANVRAYQPMAQEKSSGKHWRADFLQSASAREASAWCPCARDTKGSLPGNSPDVVRGCGPIAWYQDEHPEGAPLERFPRMTRAALRNPRPRAMRRAAAVHRSEFNCRARPAFERPCCIRMRCMPTPRLSSRCLARIL